MSTKLLLAAALLMVVAYALLRDPGNTSRDEAHRLVDAGALLLDVRTPAEFAEAHIPQALNIPVQVLETRLAELPDKARPIVIYCRSGNRSARAKQMLLGAGYASVHDLGAMSNW